ncbi:MAG: reverse transcriptase domain-containing protein, partial [Acidimicrobiales bacterium]
FEAIPHDRLVAAVEERVCDRHVLKLLRVMLRAGVMLDGAVRRSDSGTPQGGVVSPLLANIYLHRLDKAWRDGGGVGVLVRYCDDLVVMCRSQKEAEGALGALTDILHGLGLEPKASKTRTVHLVEGGEGLDFLGFHHRWVSNRSSRSRQHVSFLARWPTRQAMQRARDRIRELTMRRWVLLPVEDVVGSLNRFLRGWAGFFRYGNSSQHFIDIRWYAQMRLARFVAKRHGRRPAFGRWMVGVASADQFGLVSLSGLVVAPRPNRPWRGKPNAGGERRR